MFIIVIFAIYSYCVFLFCIFKLIIIFLLFSLNFGYSCLCSRQKMVQDSKFQTSSEPDNIRCHLNENKEYLAI